ncbi:MAG: undecaprenyl/decaprenyl-phosphate alpha-N-acetylglucosaminyl 1-phosphate transferase [Bacteroidales bacterium]|nr:undecaprenyl/decaprenyl-phosphate alpha-N-acetylglucosaminyl 1-phosphate transferase [Bacteroidales bacterium]
MTVGLILIPFLLALGICLVLMPPFIKLMEKYRILDKAGGRKIHTGYTAHMGGIVIFIAFTLASVAMMFIYQNSTDIARILYVGIVLLVMLFVGVRDDMHNISAWSKLFFEIIVGVFMSYIGIRIENLNGFLGLHEIPVWLGCGITTCFFIVVVNAYNLIDGIDGQAGMQAINVFFFTFMFYLLVVGAQPVGGNIASPSIMYISSLAILGAVAGFLRYNWQPARIFMGDTGSLFIGTLITVFIILTSKYSFLCNVWDFNHNSDAHTFLGLHLKATIAPFISLFYLPLADTLRVFINRIRHGKSPFHADRTHIHHLFIRLGFSHQKCTLITFTISFCISVSGFICAFLFNDNICIFLIVISWFLYVYILHFTVIQRINRVVVSQK